MNAALTDLQNRINSNTLTVAQQAALSQALIAINPTFPSPDELGNGIPSDPEEDLARNWFAVLYAVQAEFSGGGAVVPTTQIVWHINALTGNNANDGLTSGTAIQSAAYLASLWRGTAGGGRPQLNPASGTTITVFIDSDLPGTDPLSVLLDVDLVGATQLLLVGATKAPTRTGAMTAASTFARTHAGGQQTFTDAGVADFSPFIGTAMLAIDTTLARSSVAWLVGPDGAPSATATTTPFYTPANAGATSVFATPVQPLALDGYTLSALTTATLGSGWTSRQFPSAPASGVVNNAAITFYRLHLPLPAANDQVTIGPNPGVITTFQECQGDSPVAASGGAVVQFFNCLGFHNNGYSATGGAAILLFAGGLNGLASGSARCLLGGIIEADGDFALVSTGTGNYSVGAEGIMNLGNVSKWGTGGPLCTVAGGKCILNPIAQASSIFYGADGGDFLSVGAGTLGGSSVFIYSTNGGSLTPAADQFKSTSVAFLLGRAPATSSWGPSAATGELVGPTTNTITHLDAVLGAGTGFGGNAQDLSCFAQLAVAA